MEGSVSNDDLRGSVETRYWGAECKDCLAEKRLRAKGARSGKVGFEYSGSWADRAFELGQTRSDRCERHRRLHKSMIAALSVPYVDLRVTSEVRDRDNPTGPLGGLGPLPKPHSRRNAEVDLSQFGFGMGDADILAILNGLRDKRVAVVEAGTGTGKSTFMPFRLMSPPNGSPFRPTQSGPIIVTEPRRQAATGVATFVGEQLVFGHDSTKCHAHVGPGFPVGYQVSQDRNWDSACDLIYVTDGTMINWIRDGSLARIGTVIVDEAHERSANIDIILAQLREKLNEYKHLRVIVTSATIDRDFFVDYFGGPTQVYHHSVPAKKTFGYGVPLFVGLSIDEHLIADGLIVSDEVAAMNFSGWSGIGPNHEGFPPDDLAFETAKLAKLRLDKEIPKERWVREMPRALAEQVVAIADGTEFGDILGFLPTTLTIQEAIGHIRNQLKRPRDFDIYPLLSKTPRDITAAAVSARKRGERRKIVISSNLAETSLTVSGVRYVVDSGLICQSDWDPDLASGGMPKLPHSQSGLRQRWGRVGRDAPGWVFPLYTVEQFQTLPKDTPPATARSNLEEFCTRLASSGLDPEKAVLPGNFESDNYKPDAFAKASAEVFSKELARANLTLKVGGIIDSEGDLTALGAEIERYSGPASEALAVVLGDRLACQHEVALGLALVTRGKLHGKYGVLRIDFDWPPEWRLRAKTCHRALAAGCRDDLDLAFRIAVLYQQADDPDCWCRTWWVNGEALAAALADVAPILAKLSAAMKHDVSRPYLPELLPRARAAITQAFMPQAFRDMGDGRFESIVDEQPAFGPGKLLVPDTTLILGFDRYETGDVEAANVQRIGHFIAVDETVAAAAANDDTRVSDDFDLLLGLSDPGRPVIPTPKDTLHDVRIKLPIGTVVRLTLEDELNSTRTIKAIERGADPFMMPASLSKASAATEDNGFDPEWDFQAEEIRAESDEPQARVVDPRKLEINDKAEGAGQFVSLPTLAVAGNSLPPLRARSRFLPDPLEEGRPCLISDYEIEGDTVVLLVEPLPDTSSSLDPAWHDDLKPLCDVDMQFLGTSDDSFWPFLCFRVSRTMERIDVAAEDFLSLDRYARSAQHSLQPGDRLKALVVSQRKGRRSVSIRAALRTSIDTAPQSEGLSRGQIVQTHGGVVVSAPNAFGSIEVALDAKLAPAGVTMCFQAKLKDLERKSLTAEPGQSLEVSLASTFDEAWALGPLSDQLDAIVNRYSKQLAVKGNRIHPLGPIDPAVARELLALDDDEEWAIKVSGFLHGSQRLYVTDVFPALHRRSVTGSKLAVTLVKACRSNFEMRFGVKAQVSGTDIVMISGSDRESVALAADHLCSIDGMRYIAARVPQAKIGRILGAGGSNLRALSERPGLDWAWFAESVIFLMGLDRQAVEAAFTQIRSNVEGEIGMVTVPSSQIGRFIGKGGESIRALKEQSGCRISGTGADGMWKVEAPSKRALDVFLASARSYASDLVYRHETSFNLDILINSDPSPVSTRKKAATKSVRAPLANKPEKPSGPAPSEVKQSTPNSVAPEQTSTASPGFWSKIRSRFLGS